MRILMGMCAVLALAAPLLLQAPARADAHANYVESEPPANSVLETPPTQITVRYTEPLEPDLSRIEVLDARGKRVDAGDSAVDPGDRLLMSVTVAPLENGTYTVVWKNVSTVDGHLVRGAFVFSVGEPISTDTSVEIDDQPLLQSPMEPVNRWLVLLGGLAMAGGPLFQLLVARPVWRSLRGSTAGSGASEGMQAQAIAGNGQNDTSTFANVLSTWSIRVMWGSVVLFVAASVLQLLVQTSVVFDLSIAESLGSPTWALISGTEWGNLWMWRLLLTMGTGLALALIWRWGESSGLVVIASVLAVGALLTISLTSHAAATSNVTAEALANDFIHLLAVAVWVGGLAGLATWIVPAIRLLDSDQRQRVLPVLVRRFSLVAGVSVGVLVLTGIYGAWAQVTVFQAMSTPYGTALAAKLAVVCVLLLVAGANLLYVRPKLGSRGRAAYWLRRLVAAEIVLGVVVLLAVGFLTALEPARQVASRAGVGVDAERTFSDTIDGTQISMSLVPGAVGPNTVKVSLRDRSGEPIVDPIDVRVRLSYLEADLGEIAYSATALGNGDFALEDQLIGVAGAWQAELVVQRLDAFDARAAFRFEVGGGSGGSLAISPSSDTGRTLLGIEIGVVGVLLLAGGIPLGGWFSRAGMMTMIPGAVAVCVAIAVLFFTLGTGDGTPTRNPVPPTQDSVAAGLELYNQNCVTCHGSDGRGGGAGGVALDPPPADLVIHVPHHPDRALFEFVKNGIAGSGMAGVGDKLSDEEIWDVVNYIQTLE